MRRNSIMMIHASATLLLLTLTPAAGLQGGEPTPRAAVPSAAEQKRCETAMREVFKEAYAKTTAADRAALARRLLDEGRRSSPADEKYVFLREARDLAQQAGEVELSLQALAEMGSAFQVDRAALAAVSISALAKNARAPGDWLALAHAALELSRDAVVAGDLKAAERAARDAASFGTRAKDPVIGVLAEARFREVKEADRASQDAAAAREKLEAAPGDAEASLSLGSFLFLYQGDRKGLPYLAKSPDPLLQELARNEQAAPEGIDALTTLADDWWTCSEKQSGVLRRKMREHAVELYQRALFFLSGLDRVKAEKRLEAFLAESRPQVYAIEREGQAGNKNEGNVYSFELKPNGKKVYLRYWATGKPELDTHGEVQVQGQVVHRWSPADFKVGSDSVKTYRDVRPTSVDISRLVTGPGPQEVKFRFRSGKHALRIYRVEIVIF